MGHDENINRFQKHSEKFWNERSTKSYYRKLITFQVKTKPLEVSVSHDPLYVITLSEAIKNPGKDWIEHWEFILICVRKLSFCSYMLF